MKAFISYRAKEHRDLVPRIANKLDSEGIDAIYDEVILPKHQSFPHRSATLPLFNGVQFVMLENIQACDVMIHLLPSTDVATPDEMQYYKDFADLALEVVSVSPEFGSLVGLFAPSMPEMPYAPLIYQMQVLWYETFYGLDIRKRFEESWQEWEIRVGKLVGISFVRVCVARGAAAVKLRESSALVIDSDNLEDEIMRVLLPFLRRRPLRRKKPRPLPKYRPLFAVSRGVTIGIGTYGRASDSVENAARRIKGWLSRHQ